MTIYYGTDGNDKIDGNTLANDINFIDAKKGDDVVILKNWQNYQSGPGKDQISAPGYGSIHFENAIQRVSIDISKSLITNDGYGDQDTISGIQYFVAYSSGLDFIGGNTTSNIILNGGSNTVTGGSARDSVWYFGANSNYEISRLSDNSIQIKNNNSKSVDALKNINYLKFDGYLIYDTPTTTSSLPLQLNPTRIDIPFSTFGIMSMADINNDGFVDLVIPFATVMTDPQGTPAGQGVIYFGNGKNGFYKYLDAINDSANFTQLIAVKVFLTDFNNDGYKDIFLPTFGMDVSPFYGEKDQIYLSNINTGKWYSQSSNINFKRDITHSGTITDINNDGFIDTFSGNLAGENSELKNPYFLLNDGKGNFTFNIDRLPERLLNQSTIGKNALILSESFSDLNGDGWNDLIVGGYGNKSQVFISKQGYFSDIDSKILPQGFYEDEKIGVLDIKGTDLNGDGIKEIVKLSLLNDYSKGVIDIYSQNAFGDWSLKSNVITSAALDLMPPILDLIDIDTDGDIDIVATTGNQSGGGTSAIWLNSGDGFFKPVTTSLYSGLSGPYSTTYEFNGQQFLVSLYPHPLAQGYDLVSYKYSSNPTKYFFIEASTDSTSSIYGTSNADYVYGPLTSRVISTKEGNDIITAADGGATIDGGKGFDTVLFSGRKTDYSIEQISGTSTSWIVKDLRTSDGLNWGQVSEGTHFLTGVESLSFSTGVASKPTVDYLLAAIFEGTLKNDILNLDAGAEKAFGYDGDDVIKGAEGNDSIDGGLGVDTAVWDNASSNFKISFIDNQIKVEDISGVDGIDTLSKIEKLQFTDRSVFIESQSHGSYSDLPTELYQFFITAFNAAPGVTYMDQLADAYRWFKSTEVNPVKKIVDIFTTKSQFTDVYSPSLSHADMATQLVTNIVKNSATTAAKTEAIADIKAALDIGWTVGDVIYTVFGNLAHKSQTDTNWGNTAKQFNNEIAVAKYYTETLNQSTTDLETLRDVIQPVTQTTNVSTDAVVAQLIGVALMTGGQGT